MPRVPASDPVNCAGINYFEYSILDAKLHDLWHACDLPLCSLRISHRGSLPPPYISLGTGFSVCLPIFGELSQLSSLLSTPFPSDFLHPPNLFPPQPSLTLTDSCALQAENHCLYVYEHEIELN